MQKRRCTFRRRGTELTKKEKRKGKQVMLPVWRRYSKARGRRTQEGSQLPGEEEQHSSGRLWNMPLRVRELELCFNCSPCVSKHWQVVEELQQQNRIRSYEANKKLFSKESGCRLQGKHGNWKNGFPLWVPLDLNDECCERIFTILMRCRWHEIGQCQHTCSKYVGGAEGVSLRNGSDGA